MTSRLTFFDTLDVGLRGAHENVAHAWQLWSPFASGMPQGEDREGHSGGIISTAIGTIQVDVTDLAEGCAEINRAAVAACPLPAAHAAVVATGGVAVAIPAVSGAGKSTLAAALCRAGADYFSDEALVLDADGRAVPYPKPLALSAWSLAAIGLQPAATAGEHGPAGAREFLVAPQALGATAGAATRVGHIVLPSRGTDEVDLVELPRRDGLAAVLAMGFNHYRDPRTFLRHAAQAVRASQVWQLRYDEPREAARVLLDRLG